VILGLAATGLCRHEFPYLRFLLRSHDCGLACCRLVPFVWSAWSFVLAVVLVPPRLIRASCRYSFLLLSHVSNDRCNEAVSLLQATLEEEKDTDEKLSKFAVTPINQKAEAAE
jgi:hypothetical protein